MALVMNASSQEQEVRVHGSWFTFKPKQIKDMHEDKAFFLISQRNYLGFVAVPEACQDLEYRSSKEGKAELTAAEAQGISNRCAYLDQLRQNEIVSLQRDLHKSNQNYDARLEMSSQMLKNLEELAGYQVRKQDEAQEKLSRIKDIEALLEK